jgi:hypothetical protein
MTSIAFGVVIIFILYVMIWSIKNDGAKSISDQIGLIRMRELAKTDRKATGRNWQNRRPPATPHSQQVGRHRSSRLDASS